MRKFPLFFFSWNTSVNSSSLSANSFIKNSLRQPSFAHAQHRVTCLLQHPPQDIFNHSHRFPNHNPISHSHTKHHTSSSNNNKGIHSRCRHRHPNKEPPALLSKVGKPSASFKFYCKVNERNCLV